MTWLVFGVSCLLVLAGAVSIISGAPIIQLERGWAEVISGTVALSSGGVVFALAGILMRLEAIRDTMAARTLPVGAETVAPPVSTPASEAAPAQPPVPPATPEPLPSPPVARPVPSSQIEVQPSPPPAPEQTDDGKSQGLWKRVKRSAAEKPDAEGLRQQGFPDRVLPEEPTGPTSKDDIPVVVPAHAVVAPSPAVAPNLPASAPRVEATPRENLPGASEAGQIGWLERSLFKGRATQRPGEEAASARPEPTFGARPTDERIEPPSTLFESSPAKPLPEPTAAAEPHPTPDIASEQHEGATVIGRYQAGSASYVMYSDGTIEVETESGEIHRFGSMDELKAFIAQQDTTVS